MFVRIVAWLAVMGILAGAGRAQVYEGKTLVEARLLADTTAIVPGQPFRVGLGLRMAPGWHTYWQYAGDAGIATSLRWTLPPGFGVGPIEWPLPRRIVEPGDIQVYAYKGEVLLTQTVVPPADLAPGATVDLKAVAAWLVCEEICVPGQAELTLSLPVAAEAEPANAGLFRAAAARLPSAEAPPFAVDWKRDGANWVLTADAPNLDFLPLPAEGQEVGHATVAGSTITIAAPGALRGVLVSGDRGWLVQSPEAAVADAGKPTPPAAAPSLWPALLGGLLGGLILNLMPCVLPVISLKIFGFVRQAGQSRRAIALHGVAFAAGIFAWFLALGLVVVAIRASGVEATWAFQFQNPYFNLAVATVVFAFALNLFGVFELALPGRATTAIGEAGAREGYGGSFFQGVFATLLATPCTGPFLGSSLAVAFTQPAPVTLLLFGSIALGMALPYLALSLRPGWVRFLPRPGAWMERLKQFMGFPLLAALLWLLYIIGGQRGATAVIWAAAFLLTLGLALWIYGLVAAPHVRARPRALGLAAALALALGGGWVFIGDLFAREQAPAAKKPAAALDGIAWQPFSQKLVDDLLAEGKPVFIDFTADWCLTCKYNERVAINVPAVRTRLAELGITPVKADWTNANPEITAALRALGRVGVPVYALYPAGQREPILLPEILTEGLVLEALSRAR